MNQFKPQVRRNLVAEIGKVFFRQLEQFLNEHAGNGLLGILLFGGFAALVRFSLPQLRFRPADIRALLKLNLRQKSVLFYFT